MKRNTLLLLLLMAVTLLALPSCARIVAARPDADGEIEIVMSDYTFQPDVIRLKVGQTVHLRLRNEGSKMHEFMAGRDVQVHGNFTEPFAQDFFAGLDLEITGPGMVMGMEGMEVDMDMGGMEMEGEEMDMEGSEIDMEGDEHAEEGDMAMEGDEHTEEEMQMEDAQAEDEHVEDEHADDEMDMDMAGEDEHADEDEHTADEEHAEGEGDEHEEEAVSGQFGAIQMPEMDAHAGLMVMIDPQMIPAGEETTITFTVPEDKVGRWEFGCFQERGQHYDDGMDGVIIVEP